MRDWPRRSLRKIFRLLGLEVRRAHGFYDHEFDHTFMRLGALRDLGFHPDAICDIGASDGKWSRKCLEIFPRARYFCVDPLVENEPHLARLGNESPNVSYWLGCLGPEPCLSTMNVDGDGSSILPGHWGNSYGSQREVRVETLDNLIQRGICPQQDLLKLDVQGYELEVLKGATGALEKNQAVIAEVSFFPFQSGMPVFSEVVGQLAAYGFVVFDILSLRLRPLDGVAGQADLLFLRAMHPLRTSNRWGQNSVY